MTMRRTAALTAVILVLSLAGSGAWAAEAGYLAPDAMPDSLRLLPPPPAAGSGTQADDTAAFAATRALKDQPRWALAANDVDQSPEAAFLDFTCALGVTLDDGSAPSLSTLFSRVAKDARGVVDPPKDHYGRHRPYVDNPGDICVAKSEGLARSPSYPSGHTTLGWAWALILTELAPDRATEILLRGRVYGESRVVCGVHYPSDIEAGRTNGAALVAALHGNASFRADLERARGEVEAARKAGRVRPDPAVCAVETEAGAHPPGR